MQSIKAVNTNHLRGVRYIKECLRLNVGVQITQFNLSPASLCAVLHPHHIQSLYQNPVFLNYHNAKMAFHSDGMGGELIAPLHNHLEGEDLTAMRDFSALPCGCL